MQQEIDLCCNQITNLQVVEIIDGALAANRSPRLPGQPSRDGAEDLSDAADALLSSDLSNLALAVSSILASQSLSPQVGRAAWPRTP